MAEHTPGPWFVFPNGHCVGGPTGLLDADPNEKTAGVAMCGMRLRTEEEIEANARLIAAAPDLLAACEDYLRELQSWSESNTPPTDSTMAELRQRTADAIAKAKGKP